MDAVGSKSQDKEMKSSSVVRSYLILMFKVCKQHWQGRSWEAKDQATPKWLKATYQWIGIDVSS